MTEISGLAKERVLVVGGGGFIGRYVVSAFLRAGAKVTAMDLFPPPEGEPVVGSVADEAWFASAVSGHSIVAFLANSSLPGSANADLAAEVDAHVRVTIKAAEICQAHGVERFLFASSGGTVYGHSSAEPLREDSQTSPRNAYGVSKLSVENYLRVLGFLRDMTTVSLRIANPYGEGQRATRNQGFIAAAMQRAMTGEPLSIWGDGTVERDFLYVGDVASAFLHAAQYRGEPAVLNIGSGQSLTLLEAVKKVEVATGREIATIFEHGRPIDVQKNVLCIQKAKKTIGWAPTTSIDEGLSCTAAWWQEVSSK